MTAPDTTDHLDILSVGLWPTRDQLVSYLDSWVGYVNTLEERLRIQAAAAKRLTEAQAREIADLHRKLDVIEEPYKVQIRRLETDIDQALTRTQSAQDEIAAATSRLIRGLEKNPKQQGLHLLGLINEALVLIEEAKRQLRDSL